MEQGPSKIYPLSDPAILLRKIQDAGGPVIADLPSGTVVEHGVTFNYTISNGTIAIHVVKKPWIYSYDMIFGQLDKLFA